MKDTSHKSNPDQPVVPPADARAARALRKAARIVGGFTVLASRLDVSTSTPRMWLSRRRVPEGHCLPIELLTGGQVKCESLRPDLRPKWAQLRRSIEAQR